MSSPTLLWSQKFHNSTYSTVVQKAHSQVMETRRCELRVIKNLKSLKYVTRFQPKIYKFLQTTFLLCDELIKSHVLHFLWIKQEKTYYCHPLLSKAIINSKKSKFIHKNFIWSNNAEDGIDSGRVRFVFSKSMPAEEIFVINCHEDLQFSLIILWRIF